MKWFKSAIVALGLVLSLSAAPVLAADEGAKSGIFDETCGEGSIKADSAICADQSGAKDVVKRIIDLFLYAAGVLSAIMVIFSGVKYVTSNGDAEKIKSAKSTLQYAIIGVIVSILAFTIVNFVVDSFDNTPATSGNSPSKVIAYEPKGIIYE